MPIILRKKITPSIDNSFSRIDYFYISRQVPDRVEKCTVGSGPLSDHADMSMFVTPPFNHSPSRHWRLNPSILSSLQFVAYLEKQTVLFLATNDNADTNPSTLWETLKAYLREAIISYYTAKKKEALRTQTSLEKELLELEKQLKEKPSKTIHKRVK